MIAIQEIPIENIDDFWKIHMKYLVEDHIVTDQEDIDYFKSNEYRDIIREHMCREQDRHHMIYFVEEGKKIGAAQYNIYQSEDGKCFILDFWVFREFRGSGTGHRCFRALEEYTKCNGAVYYEINCEREDAFRFWQDNGFVENGEDEYGMTLMIKRRQ